VDITAKAAESARNHAPKDANGFTPVPLAELRPHRFEPMDRMASLEPIEISQQTAT
jgi:hypothetical protein